MSDDDKLRIKALKGIIKSGTRLHIDISTYKDELYESTTQDKSKSKKVRVEELNTLKDVHWQDSELTLTFSKKLPHSYVKYFTLIDKKKSDYKYVFDIYHSSLNRRFSVTNHNLKRVRIGQYNPKTLRVVIVNNRPLKIMYDVDSRRVTISATVKHPKKVSNRAIKSYKYTPPKRLDRNKVIVIDAGHGGKDPGAVGYKRYREKIVVFKIAKHLNKILKARGYKVHMTRDRDKFIKLSQRTALANKKNADLFISIHANAVPKSKAKRVQGIECYFLSPSRSKRAEGVAAQENSADITEMNQYAKQNFLKFLNHAKTIASHKLAIDLQRGMLGSLNKHYKSVKDGGVREGPFWVLVGAQMPAVLVEVGFISNPKEAKRLVNNNYRKRMAMGIADGVERYFENN